MLKLNVLPKNKEYFKSLLDFCEEVVETCKELGIQPVLSASLAVLAYTKDQEMEVNDIDLSCSESDFPKLRMALEAKGITTRVTEWHVLQALRDNLKVEFDSKEYWLKDLPEDYETLQIGTLQLKVVKPASLKELYRRGLEDTADKNDEVNKAKNRAISKKYEALNRLTSTM